MKRILITGGAGFIGSNTAEFFSKKKWKVYILDNLSRKGTKINLNRIKNRISKFYLGDITNYSKLNQILKVVRPNVIIHAAGQVAVTKSIQDPRKDFNDNLLGTFNLLESIRINKLNSKLIYTSTNKVYGNLEYLKFIEKKEKYIFKNFKKGINEKLNLDLHSPYGCSKGSADQYINDYSRIYGLDVVVLRQSCVYGENQFGIEDQGWVAWFSIASYFKKKITIYGNGKQVRDILFITDLCNLYYKIASSKKKFINECIFNVGGGHKFSLSILELLNILKKKNKTNLKIKYSKARKGDQKIFISDNTKINKFFKWKPQISPVKGVSKLILWIKNNHKLISKVI